ncbi:MAG: 5-(carboxyamino)imidazole ribonucleotide synthase [Halodesulfurarchaeum sp.]
MTIPVPGATIGVVGGGQLARMLTEAATPLGVDVIVLDPTPQCPAYPPARDQIVADFDDEEAIRSLGERVDMLTLEIELADPAGLEHALEETGTPVQPSPEDLRMTRDKLVEKSRFDSAGIPVPAYREIDSVPDLEEAFGALGSALMVKARRGGYDGRGNHVVETVEDATDYFGTIDGLLAEQMIDYTRELSVIGVSGADQTATFPVGENIHEAEILRRTVVPARTRDSVATRAEEIATDVLDELDGRGVFGIELFETADGEVLVNEIAPRPHNSGHYTIEGAETSQFEQHVRAILGLPLGSTDLVSPTMMGNLLGDVDTERPASLSGLPETLSVPGAHFHWYGKREVRPLRKMGHVTTTGPDHESNRDVLDRALSPLTFE